MPSEPRIADLGEKKLIKRLLKRSRINSLFLNKFLDEHSVKSTSDDAALVDLGETYVVASSDMLMQSTHFPDEMTPHQIGKKIVTVNVSDVAAMGADTIGIIVSMGLPRDMLLSDFDEMVEGVLEACRDYDMALIGGDTNESRELTLCGTCIGFVEKYKVLMKCGAQPGDVVAVTGPLGLAAAGFEVLVRERSVRKIKSLDPDFRALVLKHALQPEARLKEGVLLADTGTLTSATDITDGLLSEIGEIMDASPGIGVTLYSEKIPVPEAVMEVGRLMDKDPLEMALSYGEDFELLLTIKKDNFKDLKDLEGLDLHEIGFVDSSGVIQMIDKYGKTEIITAKGYEHLH
jgi:thiamine-monophosphate kinase